MKIRTIFTLVLAVLACPFGSICAQEASPPVPSAQTPSPSPMPPPVAAGIPLADVITQADTAEASLQDAQTASSPGRTVNSGARDLPLVTREIDARLAETKLLIQPGALLETLRDLETQWQKQSEELALWTRELTTRANVIDKQLARLPELRATWEKTRELVAQAGDTPAEIRERIAGVLVAIAKAETTWQKNRAAILSEQSRVAEQSKRVAAALGTIREAQDAAVSRLFVQDIAPIWSAEMFGTTTRNLTEEGQASFAAQFGQLRLYVARHWTQFIYLALIFSGFALALVWVRRGAAKWTDEDPALKRANRVLQAPFATAAVLSFLVCPTLFEQPSRLFWAILATVALVPIVSILRRLIERPLFPVLNVLVVFYVVAQLRKVVASLPGLSRLFLLVEMIGGAVFLVWFIRSTRLSAHVITSQKIARAAARLGLVLFAAIFLATIFGYFRLANYLAAGSLSAAFTAILFYAAAVILAGLIFFALRVRPLSGLRVVSLHRPLIQRRLTRILYFAAGILWALLALEEFSLRVPFLERLTTILTAQVDYKSLHMSLGAVLAFALTIWIAALLSRFIRFVLEADIYHRFRLAAGSSYATSTLLHYVILMVGFFVAIAALGVDMTKFTVLAGALGVGIGFGLQNIINNFVSGLILLFERPVNVGDVVQVGDATGMIQRIGIRASVIRIADSSELIVPNSMLISEKVTNWTLSNRQRRIELQVGVAYGTKPQRVIELLTRVAAAHPLVAKHPAPQTLMTEFGADSLNFDVRLWTDDYDQWLQIKSDVAVAITDALEEAQITIPFPQRDLHLQSIAPTVAESLRKKD